MNSMFTTIIRIALGLALLVFGANKLFAFIPMEAPTGSAGDFMSSLNATGYIFPVLGVLEMIIGILGLTESEYSKNYKKDLIKNTRK